MRGLCIDLPYKKAFSIRWNVLFENIILNLINKYDFALYFY